MSETEWCCKRSSYAIRVIRRAAVNARFVVEWLSCLFCGLAWFASIHDASSQTQVCGLFARARQKGATACTLGIGFTHLTGAAALLIASACEIDNLVRQPQPLTNLAGTPSPRPAAPALHKKQVAGTPSPRRAGTQPPRPKQRAAVDARQLRVRPQYERHARDAIGRQRPVGPPPPPATRWDHA